VKACLALLAFVAACGGVTQHDRVGTSSRRGDDVIPPVPKGSSITRWEYLCLNEPTRDDLATAGDNGWELVGMIPEVSGVNGAVSSTYTFCFKRTLAPDPYAQVEPSIRAIGEGVREVDRTFVAAVESNPTAWTGDAKAITAYDGRTALGVKLFAIEPGTTLDRLGLRTGDVVTAIGDHAIRSVDDLLDAWTANRAGPEILVRLTRGGAALELRIRIR